jgi:hypothetical protein
MVSFIAELLVAVVKLAPELYEKFKSAGYDDAVELRKASVKVYIAFGGEEGDAVKKQRELEALLPPQE